MKKILSMGLILASFCFSSPMSYDLDVYGETTTFTPRFGNDYRYGEYADNNNFWAHHYWNFNAGGGGRDECRIEPERNCLDNSHTHTGIDYPLLTTKVPSYGFGKILISTTNHGRVTVRNLVASGEYFKISLLHMSNHSESINANNYISKKQFIGNRSNIGANGVSANFSAHLHFEVSDEFSPNVPLTSRAYPYHRPDIENTDGDRNSIYNRGGLIAHYDNDRPDIRYYNPLEFARVKQELLPFLSRTNNIPSYRSFDIYGISNQTIYGHLNVNGTDLNKVGILARNSNSRSDAENGESTYITEKFLAESTSDFRDLYGNSNRYIKGDYLFVPYVNDNNEDRYGYPLKFSFVDENSFIIDNDKVNDNNGATFSKSFNDATDYSKVPGYFLTSGVAKASSTNFNDFGKWSVPNTTNGLYRIYAHVPKGATATQTTYTVHTKNGDETITVNQTLFRENWADLGSYRLDENSFVKLSLYNTVNGEWIGFDAIKFEKQKCENFKDFNKFGTYQTDICDIFEKGYVKGYVDLEYKPENNVTRAEFIKIISLTNTDKLKKDKRITEQEFSSSIKNTFLDVQDVKKHWFRFYVWNTLDEKIITPKSKFRPNDTINFAEASKIIVKTLVDNTINEKDADDWHEPFINKLEEMDINTFDPSHKVTRGEMAHLISSVLNWEEQ